ncbi:tRNA pseudouridine(38-40) synthase TruA [Antarcticibacterium sp. 1MA-6-2]|uniref:tRNA pseudouridine(38-40) synthase TruA n=1 Tax=Antarcticibacterium sp. 1MA-6-2 TaxID=2908210 RepID=UPI0028834278|nr:tRNA pseudouridine(38-40) synthase TruA [Antarcticibacterium sp. 1MA-6-2]
MVSANESAFELFLEETPLNNLLSFLKYFNENLPPDIRALQIEEVDADFNIIQHPKQKEYLYLFSFGSKNHPFCAPLMANFQNDLNIRKMMEGANLFEGEHFFKNYTVEPSENGKFLRTITTSEIVENTVYTANFFPEKSYIFRVKGSGFLRYQIRLMMGTLIQLGKGEIEVSDIKESLKEGNEMLINYIAPASGLILNKVDFQEVDPPQSSTTHR